MMGKIALGFKWSAEHPQKGIRSAVTLLSKVAALDSGVLKSPRAPLK